jgi:hypothetical protein
MNISSISIGKIGVKEGKGYFLPQTISKITFVLSINENDNYILFNEVIESVIKRNFDEEFDLDDEIFLKLKIGKNYQLEYIEEGGTFNLKEVVKDYQVKTIEIE